MAIYKFDEKCPNCGSRRIENIEIYDEETKQEYFPVAYCWKCGWQENPRDVESE